MQAARSRRILRGRDRPAVHGLSRYLSAAHGKPANDNGRSLRVLVQRALAVPGRVLVGAVALVLTLARS